MDWGIALHTYEPDEAGRCKSGWYNEHGRYVKCMSTQRSSVLHDDAESDFRQAHDHGGGDCMCFEDTPGGYYGAMAAYVKGRGR